MSTLCWRLPGVRLEAGSCIRARALLAVVLLIFGATAAQFHPLMIVLLSAVLLADQLRYRRAMSGTLYRFDGSRWWCHLAGAEPRPLAQSSAGYSSPWLLAVSLEGFEGDGVRRRLLLWRWQCRRETWRRLSLAARYAGLPVNRG